MNGNPSAKQKRFQEDLREMGCIVTDSPNVEIHHIFGSKMKARIFDQSMDPPEPIEKPGEWFVIPLHNQVHNNIGKYSFESERGLFLSTLTKYHVYFDYPAPVPIECVEYYKAMMHKHDITKGLGI